MAGRTPESITPKRIPLRTFLRAIVEVVIPAAGVVALKLALPDPTHAQESTPPHDWFDFFPQENGTVLGLGNGTAREAVKNGESVTINKFVDEFSKDVPGHTLSRETARIRCANDLKMAYAEQLTGKENDIIPRPDQIVLEVSPDMTPGCYDDPKISGRSSGAAWNYYTTPEVMRQNAETTGGYVIGAVGLGIVAALGRGVFQWVMNGLESERDADAVKSTTSESSKMKQAHAIMISQCAPTPEVAPARDFFGEKWAREEQRMKKARRFRIEDYWGASDAIIEAGLERLSAVGRASAFETGLGIYWGPKYANAAPLYDEIGDLPDVSPSVSNVTNNVDRRSITVHTPQQPQLSAVPRLPHTAGGKGGGRLESGGQREVKLLSNPKRK